MLFRSNLDQDSSYQVELGQCRYFLKIEEDKVKDERKERESLLKNFKKLGLKNKKLKDELKGRKGNPSKRIKLIENTQGSSKKPKSKEKNNEN